MEEKNYEISVKEIIEMLLPKLWIVAVASVLCAAIVGLFTMFTTENVYAVKMQYNVRKEAVAGGTGGQESTQDLSYAINVIPTIEKVYESGTFCTEVKNKLAEANSAYSEIEASSIGSMIKFTHDTSNAAIYSITIRSANENLANDVATVVHSLTRDTIAGGNYSAVQELAGITLAIETYTTPGAAFISQSVTSEVIKKAILVFAVVAVLLSLFIVVYGILDPTVRDKNKLAKSVDAPVLGIIPRF